MKRLSLAAVTTLFLMVGACQSQIEGQNIGDSVIILGALGLPVGQEMTITGVKKSVGPFDDMFSVETINGKPASKDLLVQVVGIDKWADGTAATLRGNEVGTLRFIHLYETNFGPDDPRWKGPHQQLFLRFHVSEVVAPKDLKVDEAK